MIIKENKREERKRPLRGLKSADTADKERTEKQTAGTVLYGGLPFVSKIR